MILSLENMVVSLQFGNCAGSTSNSSLFGYLSMKISCNTPVSRSVLITAVRMFADTVKRENEANPVSYHCSIQTNQVRACKNLDFFNL